MKQIDFSPYLTHIEKLVKELKCPQCKAYAHYLKKDKQARHWVLCRKCDYRENLQRYLEKHMGLFEQDGALFVQFRDMFGDEQTKELIVD